MIKEEIVKYWIPAEELLKKFGFDQSKGELLMEVKVYVNPKAPLGYQVQGIDIFVEHPTEVKDGAN